LDCFNLFNEDPPNVLRHQFPTNTYDFFLLFEFLEATAVKAKKPYSGLIKDVQVYVEKCVLTGKFIGSEVDCSSFSGLSIYLNKRVNRLEEKRRAQIEYNYSFYSRFQNDFARLTLWPEFIQLYEKTSVV
jgi:hypothetical protein